MSRTEARRHWRLALAATAASSAGWALWIASATPHALAFAIVLHVAGAVVTAWSVPGRRDLALALALAVPAIGPLAGALAATVRGHGGFALVREPPPRLVRVDGTELAHALSGALPTCDAVCSTDADVRRAALGTLSLRASAEDIALLRWVSARGTGEIALDAALLLEDISQQFERRAAAAQTEAKKHPDYDTNARAFRVLAAGIESQIVDSSVVGRFAALARAHHDAAIAADATRARELLAERARMEIATGEPAVALALLGPALGEDLELTALYKEAAYAARRFELASELTHMTGAHAVA